jgi:hypothetical protein
MGQIEEAADSAPSDISRGKHHSLDPRVDQSSRAHNTRFQCSIKRHTGQPPVSRRPASFPERYEFTVRGRVVVDLDPVVTGADDLSVLDNHRADGRLSLAGCLPSKVEGQEHEVFM